MRVIRTHIIYESIQIRQSGYLQVNGWLCLIQVLLRGYETPVAHLAQTRGRSADAEPLTVGEKFQIEGCPGVFCVRSFGRLHALERVGTSGRQNRAERDLPGD